MNSFKHTIHMQYYCITLLPKIRSQMKQCHICITTDTILTHITMLIGKGNTFCNSVLKKKCTINRDNISTVYIGNMFDMSSMDDNLVKWNFLFLTVFCPLTSITHCARYSYLIISVRTVLSPAKHVSDVWSGIEK